MGTRSFYCGSCQSFVASCAHYAPATIVSEPVVTNVRELRPRSEAQIRSDKINAVATEIFYLKEVERAVRLVVARGMISCADHVDTAAWHSLELALKKLDKSK